MLASFFFPTFLVKWFDWWSFLVLQFDTIHDLSSLHHIHILALALRYMHMDREHCQLIISVFSFLYLLPSTPIMKSSATWCCFFFPPTLLVSSVCSLFLWLLVCEVIICSMSHFGQWELFFLKDITADSSSCRVMLMLPMASCKIGCKSLSAWTSVFFFFLSCIWVLFTTSYMNWSIVAMFL